MKIKLPIFVSMVLMSVLLTSVFFVAVSTSEFPSDPPGTYSPWADLDDDGDIDIFDIVWMAGRYGTTGTPINKTQLLLDLLLKIDQLNTTIIEQQNTINLLNETVIYLNNTRGLGPPDYDSGWRSIPVGQELYLTHNLNTTELFVYFIGRQVWDGNDVMHQHCFGGDTVHLEPSERGAFWNAPTNKTIQLYRGGSDTSDFFHWDYVRVLIWKIPEQ